MKKFLLTIAILFTAVGYSAPKMILDYHYGNQITHSYLSIFDDGSIERFEKAGGPAPKIKSAGILLTPESLKLLLTAIDEIEKSKQEIIAGTETNFGSSSGTLFVFDNAKPYIVRTIVRAPNPAPGKKDVVTFNKSEKARWIEKLVTGLVEVRMPTPYGP